jgi:hypothetical protein
VAVRDRDFDAIGTYLASEIGGTPFPAETPAAEPVLKWVAARSWPLPADETLPREIWLGRFREFLTRFGSLADARFKVKGAHFDSASQGEAHIKYFLVTRNEAGRREWIKGTGHIEVVRQAEGPWQIAGLTLDELASKVSQVELFSEVAFPAGVSTVFPAFGVGKNQGFVSHGAAVADVNNDGLQDLAATGVETNQLYLNNGRGGFEDVSTESLVGLAPVGSGALFLDYDNDGDADLFLAGVGPQVLFENRFVPDGEVRFWDVSEQAGMHRDAVGFSAVAADVNGDGFTDIYVCSYNRYGTVTPNSWHRATNGTPNLLFINRGDGTFAESAKEWGVDDGRWSYAAGFIDIDNDGDQDLYVDNDGDFDLHVTNMSSTAGNRILQLLYPEEHEIRRTLSKQAAGNSLYAQSEDGSFREVTEEAGGLSGGWAFGGGFVDFDNDGREDIYTPNGFISGKSMKDT